MLNYGLASFPVVTIYLKYCSFLNSMLSIYSWAKMFSDIKLNNGDCFVLVSGWTIISINGLTIWINSLRKWWINQDLYRFLFQSYIGQIWIQLSVASHFMFVYPTSNMVTKKQYGNGWSVKEWNCVWNYFAIEPKPQFARLIYEWCSI